MRYKLWGRQGFVQISKRKLLSIQVRSEWLASTTWCCLLFLLHPSRLLVYFSNTVFPSLPIAGIESDPSVTDVWSLDFLEDKRVRTEDWHGSYASWVTCWYVLRPVLPDEVPAVMETSGECLLGHLTEAALHKRVSGIRGLKEKIKRRVTSGKRISILRSQILTASGSKAYCSVKSY